MDLMPPRTGRITISDAAGEDTRKWIDSLPMTGHAGLRRVRDHYEGGPASISDDYFRMPDGMERRDWRRAKQLLTHVNLVRPSVRCWTSAIYSGDVSRVITANPHRDAVDTWVHSYQYEQAVEAWCENAVAYGTAVAMPAIGLDGLLTTWLPDPLYTWIMTDPGDLRRVTAIAEVRKERIVYATLAGQGWATADRQMHTPWNPAWLPVAMAYGQDRRHCGEVYGLPLVGDAVEWSIRATDLMFNITLLQKLQTRAVLVMIGEVEESDRTDGWGGSKVMKLSRDSDAKFISPDPKIRETIDILKEVIGILATATSIPQDVLDATLTQSVSSAEAARIRAIPLVQRARQLVPAWRAYEQDLILAATGVLEYRASLNPINLSDLRARTTTDVQITPNIIPMSPNELTQDLIARVAAGLISPEDALRRLYPTKTPEEIASMAERVRELQDRAGGPQAMAQNAVKVAAGAGSDAPA